METVYVIRVQLGSLRGRPLGTGSAFWEDELEVAVCEEGMAKKLVAKDMKNSLILKHFSIMDICNSPVINSA